MRVRYESFGGIIGLDEPAMTLYVDQEYMRESGYSGSPLWRKESSYLSAPLTAHFSVTQRCPMRCRTCYNDPASMESTDLSTAKARRILRILARMHVFTVAFGGGEPLSRPDIFELAYYARRLGLVPTMTTNGFYIDEEKAALCQVFAHIHVSLDGVGALYQSVRGADGFEHAARAIKMLTGAGVSVGVNCVLCRPNFDHLDSLVQFLGDYGVKDIIFLRLKPRGRAGSLYESMCLTAQQNLEIFPKLKRLIRQYDLRVHVDCAMMPFIYCHRPDGETLRFLAAEGCVGANEIIEVLPDGRVRACSFAQDVTSEVWRLSEVWHAAPAFNRFRSWVGQAPEPCRSCEYLSLCRGGCRAVAIELTGDFNAPDPECPMILERSQ